MQNHIYKQEIINHGTVSKQINEMKIENNEEVKMILVTKRLSKD